MSWNYRLVKLKLPEGTQIGIHEAYYDKKRRVWAISKEPVDLAFADQGSDENIVFELKQEAQAMMKAFDRPMLNHEEIPEEGAVNPMDEPDDDE